MGNRMFWVTFRSHPSDHNYERLANRFQPRSFGYLQSKHPFEEYLQFIGAHGSNSKSKIDPRRIIMNQMVQLSTHGNERVDHMRSIPNGSVEQSWQ